MKRKTLVMACAAVFALSMQLFAGIALIDLGNSAQTTTNAGWNNLSAGTGQDPGPIADLVDDGGNSTGITLTYSTDGTDSGAAGAGANIEVPGDIASYPAAVAAQPASALYDSLFVSAHSVTLTFSGLDTGATYDFLIYGGRGNNGAETFYEIGGVTNSISNVFLNGTETVSFTGISPDGSGEIALTTSVADEATNGGINFVQVTSAAIPEPATIGLFAAFGGAILFIRRRRLF